jgi:hypothetical protein
MRPVAWLLAACALSAETGSKSCAVCHPAIYEKYQRSGMARSSGRVGDGLERFEEVRFRGGRVTPEFNVEFANGSFAMQYYIGSGAVGRSYAGFVDGFLFQSPASYYSARRAWGLSPGYSTKTFVDVARPVETACLQCHASGSRAVAGTTNRYPDPPFTEGGVSCERCHGTGDGHRVVNPAKLPAARRDSVCLQCHLTGAARIAQPGRGPESFRAGDLLADHMLVFVWSRPGEERAATDHAEQLARSRCQQSSGDKLWCGTCHDAHAGSTRQAACLDCHQPHANAGAGCTGCHMPKGRSREGEHVVFTDHSIARRPGAAPSGPRSLQPFRGMTASERDWALAERRQPLLEKLAARPDADAAVLVQLAQIYDAAGKGAALYERALRLEPRHATAQANLAIYRMQAGRAREALSLWSDVFARNPAMLAAGLNLAMGQMQVDDMPGARATLDRLLRFHPDSAQARALRAKLR